MTKKKSFIALAPGRPLRKSRNRNWKTETNWIYKEKKERKIQREKMNRKKPGRNS